MWFIDVLPSCTQNYAPEVPSDSSGTGIDFYSIPIEQREATQKLYYAQNTPNCSIKLLGLLDSHVESSCFNSVMQVFVGDTVVWKHSLLSRQLSEKPWFSVSSVAGKFVV